MMVSKPPNTIFLVGLGVCRNFIIFSGTPKLMGRNIDYKPAERLLWRDGREFPCA
jgi:hypothetical protein